MSPKPETLAFASLSVFSRSVSSFLSVRICTSSSRRRTPVSAMTSLLDISATLSLTDDLDRTPLHPVLEDFSLIHSIWASHPLFPCLSDSFLPKLVEHR